MVLLYMERERKTKKIVFVLDRNTHKKNSWFGFRWKQKEKEKNSSAFDRNTSKI